MRNMDEIAWNKFISYSHSICDDIINKYYKKEIDYFNKFWDQFVDNLLSRLTPEEIKKLFKEGVNFKKSLYLSFDDKPIMLETPVIIAITMSSLLDILSINKISDNIIRQKVRLYCKKYGRENIANKIIPPIISLLKIDSDKIEKYEMARNIRDTMKFKCLSHESAGWREMTEEAYREERKRKEKGEKREFVYIDEHQRVAWINNKRHEFSLPIWALIILLENKGDLVTNKYLFNSLSSYSDKKESDFFSPESYYHKKNIQRWVTRLRKKLGRKEYIAFVPASKRKDDIKIGPGYKFVGDVDYKIILYS